MGQYASLSEYLAAARVAMMIGGTSVGGRAANLPFEAIED